MTTQKLEALDVWRMEPTIPGPRIGTITGFSHRGDPIVSYPGMPTAPCPARVVASVSPPVLRDAQQKGHEVLLVFEAGNPRQPIIVDLLGEPDAAPHAAVVSATTPAALSDAPSPAADASIRGELAVGRILSIADERLEIELWRNGDRRVVSARACTVLENAVDPVVLAPVDADALIDGVRWLVIGQMLSSIKVRSGDAAQSELVVQAKSIRLVAEHDLVLVAGNTRLQLTAQGRFVAIADDIVSRARMTNRVMGGSVQLN
ncbi:hypothetical protein GCM10007320_64460 [Pseudorhodoferax aquiterrae]|uniref:DUF6484 domain-containing protein n=1 Tax=Pseudorhodoferax aquiterrae TaxID=747304 RepID=A0ABQ3GF19_9BURK|nr:DUF6484 domain-containing protein [Pseudorhodoferax aquiterrae]GHD03949.1 hypothetical protein GCM10007320_64460 [Pseudorhodoferax aquiterrae]